MAKFDTLFSRVVLCLVFAGFTSVAASASNSIKDHIAVILDMYGRSKDIMPSSDDGAPLKVKVGIQPVRVIGVENNVLTLLVFEDVTWTDQRLAPKSWFDEGFDGTSHVSVPADLIWIPDLEYYSAITPPELLIYQDNVVLRGDGSVMHVPFKKITSPCVTVDFTTSTYNCTVKIGSWVHSNEEIELNYLTDHVSLEPSYSYGSPWTLDDVNVKRNVVAYACCPESYTDVTYTMIVRKI